MTALSVVVLFGAFICWGLGLFRTFHPVGFTLFGVGFVLFGVFMLTGLHNLVGLLVIVAGVVFMLVAHTWRKRVAAKPKQKSQHQ